LRRRPVVILDDDRAAAHGTIWSAILEWRISCQLLQLVNLPARLDERFAIRGRTGAVDFLPSPTVG
jgi:hypothetical protein